MEELRGKLNLLKDKKKELLDNESSTQESIPVIAEPDTPSPSLTSPISTSPKRDSITDSTVPSSPLRAHVRAYLPNNQRTTVSICAFVLCHQMFPPAICLVSLYFVLGTVHPLRNASRGEGTMICYAIV